MRRDAPQPSARSRRAPHLKTLSVLFLCAGIAGLGLLTGGDHPVARAVGDPLRGYFPGQMPRYPGVRELPAGRSTRVGPNRTRMSYFVTDDEPAKVGDFYAAYWRRRRLWVREDVTHRGGAVAAVDVEHDRIYQLLLVRRGDSTLAFPSVNSDAVRLGTPSRAKRPPVPLFEGSRTLLDVETSAAGNRARLWVAVGDGTVAEHLAHYRSALVAAGYARQAISRGKAGPPRGEGERMRIYRHRDGSELTLSVAALGKRRTRVQIVEMEGR